MGTRQPVMRTPRSCEGQIGGIHKEIVLRYLLWKRWSRERLEIYRRPPPLAERIVSKCHLFLKNEMQRNQKDLLGSLGHWLDSLWACGVIEEVKVEMGIEVDIIFYYLTDAVCDKITSDGEKMVWCFSFLRKKRSVEWDKKLFYTYGLGRGRKCYMNKQLTFDWWEIQPQPRNIHHDDFISKARFEHSQGARASKISSSILFLATMEVAKLYLRANIITWATANNVKFALFCESFSSHQFFAS